MSKNENTNQSAPTVKFGLLGELNKVTDYIQVQNPAVREIASRIKGRGYNDIVAKCALYVARNVRYAVGQDNNPSAQRVCRIFKYHGPIYLVDKEFAYGWLFPNQLLVAKYGICFDTAALCCTLLRIKGLAAKVVLGAVLTPHARRLKGFHAWVEVPDKDGTMLVIETTSPRKPTVYLASDIYAQPGRLPHIYDPVCRFDETSWYEDGEKSQSYIEMAMSALRRNITFVVQ